MNIDQDVIGKIGRVTGRIAPNTVGEVMVPVRGGSESFHAYADSRELVLERGERIVVVEHYPPRTVVVSRA